MSSRSNHSQRRNIVTSTPGNGAAGRERCGSPPKRPPLAHVAPNVETRKGKSGKKASPAKKAATGAKKATGARDGSKAVKILDLLKRPGGATAKDLMKATGWQPHSIRGFLSGTVSKKMRLTVISTKDEAGVRNYAIKA
jgi:hypothetical protein